MNKKKNYRSPKSLREPIPQSEILKYYPLVKNIASYFYKLNSGVELEDLIQEGWIGLLTGIKKYDPERNISIGAFCNKYIFGRIFRSLLGTKNLLHNKKIILMDLSNKILDKHQSAQHAEIHFWDYVENTYDKLSADVFRMIYNNYKKTEIMKKHGLTNEQYNNIVEQFTKDFD